MNGADGWIRVSGVGLVTPLGLAAWETFRALLSGRTLASRLGELPEQVDPVELAQLAGAVRLAEHGADDPSVELAERAAREALAQLDPLTLQGAGKLPGIPGGIPGVLGVSKGAMHAWADAAGQAALGSQRLPARFGAAPRLHHAQQAVALGPCGYLAMRLQQRLQLPVLSCHVAACASSLAALHHASERLRRGDDPQLASGRVLVMTSESALLPMFIHSYRRLGVLPPLTLNAYRARPLDEQRSGFQLVEVGAAVVLERISRAPQAGEVELVRTAVATDTFDLVRTGDELPALAQVARDVVRGEPIDLLHPHATGTREHDPVELATLAQVIDPQQCDVYACKGALGHGLGASGLVALVLAYLCARTQQRPPMNWLASPLPSAFPLQVSAPTRAIRLQAVFAAGFGGHTAGALLRRH